MKVIYIVVGLVLMLIILGITLAFGKDIVSSVASFFGNLTGSVGVR